MSVRETGMVRGAVQRQQPGQVQSNPSSEEGRGGGLRVQGHGLSESQSSYCVRGLKYTAPLPELQEASCPCRSAVQQLWSSLALDISFLSLSCY